MRNRILLLAIVAASLTVAQTSNASLVLVANRDADNHTANGWNSQFSAISGNTYTITYTNSGLSDLDGGGSNDTMTFDVVYDFYTGSTFSAGTLTLGTPVAPQSNSQNWGDNTFESGNTLSLLVQNISYTSGEADGPQ